MNIIIFNLSHYIPAPVQKTVSSFVSLTSNAAHNLIQKIQSFAQNIFFKFNKNTEYEAADTRRRWENRYPTKSQQNKKNPITPIQTANQSSSANQDNPPSQGNGNADTRRRWENRYPIERKQDQPNQVIPKPATNHSSGANQDKPFSIKEKLNQALKKNQKEEVANLLHQSLKTFENCSPGKKGSNLEQFDQLLQIALKTDPSYSNCLNNEGESLFYAVCEACRTSALPAGAINNFLHFAPHEVNLSFKSPKTNMNALQSACRARFLSKLDEIYFQYQLRHKKQQTVIFCLIGHAVATRELESLLNGVEKKESPLQILLSQMKESNGKQKTAQERQVRLQQEWLFHSCIKLMEGARTNNEKDPSAQQLRQHVEDMLKEAKTKGGLSEESKPVDPKSIPILDYGCGSSTSYNSHVFRMDQNLDVEGEHGTTYRDSFNLVLKHLIDFLSSRHIFAENFNIVFPIAKIFSHFVKDIAPKIHGELRELSSLYHISQEVLQKKANDIAENILGSIDQRFQMDENGFNDQLLILGWTEHAIGVGIGKRSSSEYTITIANGGGGLNAHHLLYNEKLHQPILIAEGSRKEVKEALISMILLASSPYSKKSEKKEDKIFYDSLKKLKIIQDFNLPLAPAQDIGNCGLHNIKQLIYYYIQRKEASICKAKGLQVDPDFSLSTANKLQNSIYMIGKKYQSDSRFVSEMAVNAFQNKKLNTIPPILIPSIQMSLKNEKSEYILPFDLRYPRRFVITDSGQIIYDDPKKQFSPNPILYCDEKSRVVLRPGNKTSNISLQKKNGAKKAIVNDVFLEDGDLLILNQNLSFTVCLDYF